LARRLAGSFLAGNPTRQQLIATLEGPKPQFAHPEALLLRLNAATSTTG
jgi:hypothetical protein